MNYELNDEQRLLQDQVRVLLAAKVAPDLLRSTIEARAGWDAGLWREMASLGLLGAAIPEAYGGVGLGAMDLCVIAEELGRFVAPVPFFSSICLAAEALLLAGSEAQKAEWLPGLASGEVIGTFALHEGNGAPDAGGFGTVLRNGALHGTKAPVPDAAIAHLCVVALKGGALAIAALDGAGIAVEAMEGLDQLRGHARLTFSDAPAQLLDGVNAGGALERLLDKAAIYASFEQIGGAESALIMARDYAMQRYVFGRQLASYQAVKHNLANILVDIELARSNATYAAGAIDDGLPTLGAAAATARLAATKAYEKAARENLQTHGGIGFTWEANCHFHYRRARLLALNLGSAEIWTDKLIDRLSAQNDVAAWEGA